MKTYKQVKGIVRARLTFPQAIIFPYEGRARRISTFGRLVYHAAGWVQERFDAVLLWDAERQEGIKR